MADRVRGYLEFSVCHLYGEVFLGYQEPVEWICLETEVGGHDLCGYRGLMPGY